MLKPISPCQARDMMVDGALLIDVRDADEHARSRIEGARNMPLSSLGYVNASVAPMAIFHCRSGARTGASAAQLASAVEGQAYILEGGMDGWKSAGYPVIMDRKQPLELMRQVQIIVGSLVLTGVILGFLVAPAFFGLSAFVGAGLLMAGLTGWCGLARLLARMPWNRRTTAQ